MPHRSTRGPAIAVGAILLASCTSGAAGPGLPSGSASVNGSKIGSSSPVALPPTVGTTSSEDALTARPLDLPKLGSGGPCPTAEGRTYRNSQFGGIALGHGPVLPLIAVAAAEDAAPAKEGILRVRLYRDYPGRWLFVKTLWFAFPTYQGPILLRGRQLDGTGPLAMGEPPTVDPQLPAGPTANGEGGFREWPGGTWVKAAGCYGWQVDGLDFSYVIVFRAEVVA